MEIELFLNGIVEKRFDSQKLTRTLDIWSLTESCRTCHHMGAFYHELVSVMLVKRQGMAHVDGDVSGGECLNGPQKDEGGSL